ncbi:MAG TPA: FAD-dependent oxidoreductase [Terriglobia bacterium]|nr:FAD-dependent oxidoreductase [Terriglobia bacterium]
MTKIVVIGGNAAGLTAASRAKRLDTRLDITVLEKLPHIAYSTCGLPYLLAKIVSADQLISYSPETFEHDRGIKVHNLVQVNSIVPGRKRIEAVHTETGEAMEFAFDKLLIATGVKARLPSIPGTQLKNVFSVLSLQDALRILDPLTAASRVAVIGAGYAGLEFAESLRGLGKKVTLFEREPNVLPGVDPDIAQIIEFELRRFGVEVLTSSNVLALVGQDGRVNGVKSASGLGVTPADLVLLDTGVAPNTDFVQDTGIQIGLTGGIAVDEFMETNIPGVYAAGNCAESVCAIRRRPVLSAIGTVAAKQGRVAGENLAGRRSKFYGDLGTTVLKIFDLAVARTGLSSREASAERLSFTSARIEADDHASYYPGARKVWIKLIVDRENRRLLGAQAAGYGDVSKRIDVAATAISGGLTVDDVAQLDLAYSPPYGSLWDPLLVAAQAVIRKLK